MLYIDWIKDNNLFEEINKIQPSSFIVEYGSNRIDMLYRIKYGNRTILKTLEEMSVTDVAEIIVVSHIDNWNKKYALLKDELLLGVESKTVVDETIQDTTNRTGNNNQTNKISAFNDDELVTNDSNDDTVNEDTQKEISKNHSTTKTSFNVIQSQLELLNSSFIIDTVLKDVSKIVSLSIY